MSSGANFDWINNMGSWPFPHGGGGVLPEGKTQSNGVIPRPMMFMSNPEKDNWVWRHFKETVIPERQAQLRKESQMKYPNVHTILQLNEDWIIKVHNSYYGTDHFGVSDIDKAYGRTCYYKGIKDLGQQLELQSSLKLATPGYLKELRERIRVGDTSNADKVHAHVHGLVLNEVLHEFHKSPGRVLNVNDVARVIESLRIPHMADPNAMPKEVEQARMEQDRRHEIQVLKKQVASVADALGKISAELQRL
jgi:hypothetical protein